MAITGFGKPKYNTGAREWEIFKIKSGKDELEDNIFRLLPPIHKCAESGTWQVYVGTHYGYAGVNSQDPSKPRSRPFRCIEEKNMRTKMISRVCPECEKVARLEMKLEEVKAAMASQGKTEPEIKTATQAYSAEIRNHQSNRKWNSWAVDSTGKLGLLPYSHSLKKQIDEVRKDLEKKGIDILDPDTGVYINIRRKGLPPNMVEKVEVVKESFIIDGEAVEKNKKAPLTQELADLAMKILPDLTEQGGAVLSDQQIQMLVDCSGEPEEVDKIFNLSNPVAPASTPAPVSAPAPVQKVQSPVSVPQAVSAPVPVTPAPAPGSDAAAMIEMKKQLALLQAQIEAAKSVVAPQTTTAPAVAVPAIVPPIDTPAETKSAPAPTTSLSDSDFLQLFPNSK